WFFISSRRRHTRFSRDWSSDVCSSDLLALRFGLPSYEEVVKVIVEDMVIEKVILAKELADQNRPVSQFMLKQCNDIEVVEVSHEEYKQLTHDVKVIIRTGEATPYANCILQAGVNFGQ